jgi:hypothetical protein
VDAKVEIVNEAGGDNVRVLLKYGVGRSTRLDFDRCVETSSRSASPRGILTFIKYNGIRCDSRRVIRKGAYSLINAGTPQREHRENQPTKHRPTHSLRITAYYTHD